MLVRLCSPEKGPWVGVGFIREAPLARRSIWQKVSRYSPSPSTRSMLSTK
jgi:hypothetical protein